jgi:hypothetical protein
VKSIDHDIPITVFCDKQRPSELSLLDALFLRVIPFEYPEKFVGGKECCFVRTHQDSQFSQIIDAVIVGELIRDITHIGDLSLEITT